MFDVHLQVLNRMDLYTYKLNNLLIIIVFKFIT